MPYIYEGVLYKNILPVINFSRTLDAEVIPKLGMNLWEGSRKTTAQNGPMLLTKS